MSAERNFSPEEIELLSAYLDDMLNEAERTALEARLADDVGLRRELDALRATVGLIHALPMLKAPRNFTLTPQMVKSRTESGRIIRFPPTLAMSAAASFVAILLGLVLVIGRISPAPQAIPVNQSIAAMPTDTVSHDDDSTVLLQAESGVQRAFPPDTPCPRYGNRSYGNADRYIKHTGGNPSYDASQPYGGYDQPNHDDATSHIQPHTAGNGGRRRHRYV